MFNNITTIFLTDSIIPLACQVFRKTELNYHSYFSSRHLSPKWLRDRKQIFKIFKKPRLIQFCEHCIARVGLYIKTKQFS
mgnify:CR=1 FL=1